MFTIEKIKEMEKVKDLLIYEEQKNKYCIEDIFNPQNKIKVLFILESPHKMEVKYNLPLAGNSGLIMSDVVLNINIPFGLILKENIFCELTNANLEKYAIMNVCNIPMQEIAYKQEDIYGYENVMKGFKTIRNNPCSKSRENPINRELENLIIKDFKKRLKDNLKYSDIKIIVPCGRIAKSFLDKSLTEELRELKYINGVEILENINHPSNNNWYEKNGKRSVLKAHIRNMIKRIEDVVS